MTPLTRLGLGFIVIIALVGIGLVCNRKCFDLSLMNTFLLFLTVSMRFSSLLHFMLPTEVFVEDDDTSETQSFIKKHRIGSLTSATTATANNGDESGDVKSNASFIGNINSSNHSGGSVVPEMALGDGNPPEIDEDLHSRQLAVYGRETMRWLFTSNILVSGMQGLGAEIAKNLVLAGVKSVTLHDEGTVELWDLSSNFIFSENNVGKNRALVSVQKLQELNNAVVISTLTTKLTEEQLSNFQSVDSRGSEHVLKKEWLPHSKELSISPETDISLQIPKPRSVSMTKAMSETDLRRFLIRDRIRFFGFHEIRDQIFCFHEVRRFRFLFSVRCFTCQPIATEIINRSSQRSSKERFAKSFIFIPALTRTMAKDAIALMDHLGWRKAHVFGHSMEQEPWQKMQ